jgi:hypothetical protein
VCFIGGGVIIALMEPHLMNDAGASRYDVAVAFSGNGAVYLITILTMGCVRALQSRGFPLISYMTCSLSVFRPHRA